MTKDFFKAPKCFFCRLDATNGATVVEDVEYMSDDVNINLCENVDGDELSPDTVEAFIKDIAKAEAMCDDSSASASTKV